MCGRSRLKDESMMRFSAWFLPTASALVLASGSFAYADEAAFL
jgi:hypothetical protein